jgi:hypothetical protein
LCKASLLFSPLQYCSNISRVRPNETLSWAYVFHTAAAAVGGRRGRLSKSVAAAAHSVACVTGGAFSALTLFMLILKLIKANINKFKANINNQSK